MEVLTSVWETTKSIFIACVCRWWAFAGADTHRDGKREEREGPVSKHQIQPGREDAGRDS